MLVFAADRVQFVINHTGAASHQKWRFLFMCVLLLFLTINKRTALCWMGGRRVWWRWCAPCTDVVVMVLVVVLILVLVLLVVCAASSGGAMWCWS